MGVSKKHIIITVVLVIAVALIVGLAVGLTKPKGSGTVESTTQPIRPPPPPIPTLPPPEFPAKYEEYRYAAVSTTAQQCSKIGTEVLGRMGGSAVDAAIATHVCMGALEPHSSGIGGGHFMIIYDTPRGETEKVMKTIIAREMAPLAAEADMFVNTTGASTVGGLAIGVPGEIAGFKEAHDIFGRVPWADLFMPTIKLCEEGITVEKAILRTFRWVGDFLKSDTQFSEIFVKEDGNFIEVGDIIKLPKLAQTLRTIAQDPDAYYNPDSQLAQDIVADIQDAGGIITLEDLRNYTVRVRDPVNITLNDGNYTVFGPPPPSSGIILQFILNILDGFNFQPDDIESSEDRILTYHRIIEAFKFAFASRSDLGDEDFWDVEELLRNLTSDSYADLIRLQIDDTRTYNISHYDASFGFVQDGGTVHSSVYGQDGSAVGITSSINLFFGSHVMGSRTGIIFNNEMDDFSTPGTVNSFGVPTSPSNYIAPRKMPMSSMCPTIVMDKDDVVRFVSGSAGGTRILTSTASQLAHSIWFGMNPKKAIEVPRMHHQLAPNQIYKDQSLNEELEDGLKDKGHSFTDEYVNAAVACIQNTCTTQSNTGDTCIQAAVDNGRKGGAPDGF